MKLFFVLGFLACGSAASPDDTVKALENLAQSQKPGNQKPWSAATCSAPPAFCKTADDLDSKQGIISRLDPELKVVIPSLDSDTSSWGIWPSLGNLINSGNYVNLSTNHACIYIRKQNGQYNATCSVLSGELEEPEWKRSDDALVVYAEAAEKAVPLVFEDSEVRVNFSWGGCDDKPNHSIFVYRMSDQKMFPGWINQAKTTVNLVGEGQQERQAFMIAAPQNVPKKRFLMMAVTRNNTDVDAAECDLEWMVVYNDLFYKTNIAEYVDTYFQKGLVTVKLVEDCLQTAKNCSAPLPQ